MNDGIDQFMKEWTNKARVYNDQLDPLSYRHIETYQMIKEYSESKWQTIDTAPKDGTRILASENALIFIAFWDGKGFDEGGLLYALPTHWMPLPQPPQP